MTIHIACIENDPSRQFTFEQITILLKARGIDNALQIYDSRLAAMNNLPAERPDVVFINLRMRTGRQTAGLDIVRTLRQHPLCDNMVLVGMAEYAMPGDRSAAISGGCQDFVALPVRYQEVEDVILRQGVFVPA